MKNKQRDGKRGVWKMMMEQFHNKFPDIAEKETRCIIIMSEKEGLPKGEYFLLESYCNDQKCDCRTVFINVLYKDKILATIGYGWENVEFYEQWMGEPDTAQDMKGPILELTGVHTEYSEDSSLKDSEVIESLKNVRDKIFSENAAFNRLEEDIITKLKVVLFMNNYDRRDLSLSISSVLKSAKLHRSVGGNKGYGSRGYLDFISKFFNQMKKEEGE
ncbi:hypothetical protein HZA99_02120 [Candidatus Woesearchaeota archaeon]|nr:hypothetical protein [Candidatus Woesearchaeota archaeon]